MRFVSKKADYLISVAMLLTMTLCLVQCQSDHSPIAPRQGYIEPEVIVPFHPIVGLWEWDRTCETPFAFCRYPESTRYTFTLEFGNDSIYTEAVAGTMIETCRFEILPANPDSGELKERVDIIGKIYLATIYYLRNDSLCLTYRESQLEQVYAFYTRFDSLDTK